MRRIWGISFLLILACISYSCKTIPPAAQMPPGSFWAGSTVVHTEQGLVRGAADGQEVLSWLGLPFAAPPTGALRWQPPQPAAAWSGIRDTGKAAAFAPQFAPLTGRIIGDEDCLHLNIWRPASTAINLPVYVWIHGGANTAGDSEPESTYNGAELARRAGFLVISVDYRLGPLGWFIDEDLAAGENGGNFGLLDLLAALRWIQANARAFGGNPANVTLAGESAGAANILALLMTGQSDGLFSRVILQSPLDMTSVYADAAAASREVLCRALVNLKLADSDIEADLILNTLSVREKKEIFLNCEPEALLDGLDHGRMGMYHWPTLIRDGNMLPAEGFAVFESGEYPVKVPVIIGSNKDEMSVFLLMESGLLPGTPMYDMALNYGSTAWTARWAEGLAEKLSRHGDQPPVYLYKFVWGTSRDGSESALPLVVKDLLGAFHSLEVPFFLGTETIAGGAPSWLLFTPFNENGRIELSQAMQSYLRGFVRNSYPRPPQGFPDWPAFPSPENRTLPAGNYARGLVFDGTRQEARITPLSGDTASERLALLLQESSDNELQQIQALLPRFFRNLWVPE